MELFARIEEANARNEAVSARMEEVNEPELKGGTKCGIIRTN
ncbi:hypothetical protein ACFPN4_04525 [Ureibacillus thermophilus]